MATGGGKSLGTVRETAVVSVGLDSLGGSEPSPSPLNMDDWMSAVEAAQVLEITPQAVRRAGRAGNLRTISVMRPVAMHHGAVVRRPVRLFYIPDVLAYRSAPVFYHDKVDSGPPTDETLDRLMTVLEKVCRGETWPVKRGENDFWLTDDYTEAP